MIEATWIPDTDKYRTRDGDEITGDELAYFNRMERQWKASLPNYSFYDLMEIFPEAKPAAKRAALAEIKQCKEDLNAAVRLEAEYKKNVISKAHPRDRWFWEAVLRVVYAGPLREGREERIKRARWRLVYFKNEAAKQKAAKEGKPAPKEVSKITDADIQHAKEIPIMSVCETQLRKEAGRMVGKCPFHSEKTGSFVVYVSQNRFHCFSCAADGDVIDLVMKMRNVKFLEAVKLLINK